MEFFHFFQKCEILAFLILAGAGWAARSAANARGRRRRPSSLWAPKAPTARPQKKDVYFQSSLCVCLFVCVCACPSITRDWLGGFGWNLEGSLGMGQEGSHIRVGPIRSLVTVIVVTIGQLLLWIWGAKAGELGWVHYARNSLMIISVAFSCNSYDEIWSVDWRWASEGLILKCPLWRDWSRRWWPLVSCSIECGLR